MLENYLKIENWKLNILAGVIVVVGFFVLPASASAANLYWVGTDGANTDVATNWKTTDPSGCGYTGTVIQNGSNPLILWKSSILTSLATTA